MNRPLIAIDPTFTEVGYKSLTTFWLDFSIADMFGVDAVKDTFKRSLDYAKSDYKFLTEFIMVLNHKIWWWWDSNLPQDEQDPKSYVYNDLWQEMDEWAMENLKGEALEYYIKTTD